MAQVQHVRVTNRPLRVLRTNLREQLGQRFTVFDFARDQTTRVQVALLGLRDERLCERTQLLCLLGRRLNAAVQEQRRRHVPEHCFPMLRRTREMASLLTVPHYACSSSV